FFSFQAKNGIRNGHLTGVQTCALPICKHAVAGGEQSFSRILHTRIRTRFALHAEKLGSPPATACLPTGPDAAPEMLLNPEDRIRSEERRVGKECISRLAAYK